MKNLKKIVTVLVAIVMAFGLMLPVSAINTEKKPNTNKHTITITNDKSGHTYEAYQVFSGDLSDGKLTNITWGSGVKGEELLTALKANTTIGSLFTYCNTAADVAEILGGNITAEQVDLFAEVVGKYLGTIAASVSSGVTREITNSDGTKTTVYDYELNVTGDGYYLVKDKDGSVASTNAKDAYTKYILKVVGDVTVAAKSDNPTVDKVIVEENTETKYNNAAVGDTVNFKVTSRVPNMDGYNKYYFIVTDKLSNGLSLNKDSFVIKIGNTTLESDYYDVEYSEDGQTFKIIFKNFIQYNTNEYINSTITITYSAVVDTDAVIGVVGNPNTVDLTYSNNPNVDYEGDSNNTDKPKSDEPVGVTPESQTRTYVTEIILTKVDGTDATKTLSGAEFTIKGTALNKVEVTTENFTVDTNGIYYLLKNGTYTKTAPTDETASLYASTTTKYTRTISTEWVTVSKDVTAKAVTGDDGKLIFSGLAEGTYTITEIKAPDGYNLLTAPITVIIEWAAPENGTDCKWIETTDAADVNAGIITMTVANFSGATLPSTGGMGTTVFYLVGGVLVVGAAILLISKKRMNSK